MRSPCGLSAGASTRSTFSTTVCGAFCSKSWMPIETLSLKSRKKRRRSMSFLLLVEGDVARPAGQMLAAVDDQRIAGEGRCRHDETQRPHEVVGRDADAQGILAVLLGETRVGLAAAAQGEAGRDAGHPQARREGLGEQRGQAPQADLGQRVGEEVGIEIEQLLIEQVDDQAGFARRQLAGQRLRQEQRRAQVDRHVAVAPGARSSLNCEALLTRQTSCTPRARHLSTSASACLAEARSARTALALPPAAVMSATVLRASTAERW